VLGITPISSIEHMRRQIRIVAVLLATVALCCGGLLMNYLTRKVGRQIDAVSDAILEAARGDIGVQAPVYMDDDIGKIARHFNEMSLQNKRLIEDLVNAETQKNNARMEAVDYKYRFHHTQINPHFIYNSLELINAIAKVHHTPEVSRVVQLIGKYFRNITKYSDMQSITVAREFELLECCIEIYKMIRGSNIDIIMDCPEELRQVEIPTMLLQPIVENSFIHGMRGMDELFIVRLSAQCETGADGTQSCLVLTVADNGPGMDQEAVERLKAGEKSGEGQEHGGGRGAIHNIGIPNIIARLKMLYGDRAKLQIESGSEGTTTTIRLPLNEKGDGKDEERRAVV